MTANLTDAELRVRLQRAARIVVNAVDRQPPNTHLAAGAVAVWEVFTGTDDAEAAVAYARRVANPAWATRLGIDA